MARKGTKAEATVRDGVMSRRGRLYIRVKAASGRWTWEATAATTHGEAVKVRRQRLARAERVAEGLEAVEANPNNWTVAELWGETRDRYHKGKAWVPKQAPSMRLHLEADPLGAMLADKVTSEDVRRWLQRLEDKGLGAWARHNLRGALFRSYANATKRGDYRGVNPVQGVEAPATPETEVVALSPADARRLLLAATWPNKGRIAAALYLGFRKGEVRKLRKGDIDWRRNVVTVRSYKGRNTPEGGRVYEVPMHPDVVPLLREACERAGASPYVFPGKGGGELFPTVDACAWVRGAAQRAGVDGADTIRFHDLRHTFVTMLLEAGVPLATVSRLARHADVKITLKVYGHLSDTHLAEAIGKLAIMTGGDADNVVPLRRVEADAKGASGVVLDCTAAEARIALAALDEAGVTGGRVVEALNAVVAASPKKRGANP